MSQSQLLTKVASPNADYALARVSVAGGVLAGLLSQVYTQHRLQQHMQQMSLPRRRKEFIEKLRAAAKLHKDLPVLQARDFDNAAFMSPGSLGTANKTLQKKLDRWGAILYGKQYGRPGIIGHEMGHATIHHAPWYSPSRFNQNWLRPLGDTAGTILAPAAAGVVGVMSRNPLLGLGVGTGAGLLFGAPTLFNEWQASARAKNYLKALKQTPEDNEHDRKTLDKAWNTYLTNAVVPGLAAGTIGGTLGHVFLKNSGAMDNTAKRNWDMLPSTLEEAAAELAQVKTAAVLQKQANDPLKSLANDPLKYFANNPTVAGMGIGAGLGGLLGLSRRKRRSNFMAPLATGALLGAVGGGAYQYAPQLLTGLMQTGRDVDPAAAKALRKQQHTQRAKALEDSNTPHLSQMVHEITGYTPEEFIPPGVDFDPGEVDWSKVTRHGAAAATTPTALLGYGIGGAAEGVGHLSRQKAQLLAPEATNHLRTTAQDAAAAHTTAVKTMDTAQQRLAKFQAALAAGKIKAPAVGLQLNDELQAAKKEVAKALAAHTAAQKAKTLADNITGRASLFNAPNVLASIYGTAPEHSILRTAAGKGAATANYFPGTRPGKYPMAGRFIGSQALAALLSIMVSNTPPATLPPALQTGFGDK